MARLEAGVSLSRFALAEAAPPGADMDAIAAANRRLAAEISALALSVASSREPVVAAHFSFEAPKADPVKP
jgi:hypothetical protein